MFRVGLFHSRNLVMRPFVVRHSSSVPSTLVSYMKDKGIYIPMAHRVLKPDEYLKYNLYRKIKLGEHKWLDEYVSAHPLEQEERTSLTEYISDLKKQPYSIPNFGMGYILSKFSIGAFLYATQYPMAGLTIATTPNIGIFGTLLGGASILSIIPITFTCYVILKHGVTIFMNEFKSPYYNYDEMTRICNKSIDKDSINGRALENEQ